MKQRVCLCQCPQVSPLADLHECNKQLSTEFFKKPFPMGEHEYNPPKCPKLRPERILKNLMAVVPSVKIHSPARATDWKKGAAGISNASRQR